MQMEMKSSVLKCTYSFAVEIMYSRYLPKCVISLTFGALSRIYNIENAFFVCSYSFIFLTTVAQPSLTKEVISFMKANPDVNLKTLFHWNFFWENYISHFVFNLGDSNIFFFFRPCFCAYFYFVKAFEVLRLHIGAKNLINAESCKFDVLLRYETNSIKSFFVCNIA